MVNTAKKFLITIDNLELMHLKTSSKRVIQKSVEATGDLICNKIANKITGVSKNLQQNNSGTVTNEHDKEIPKERYISPKERQEIINELGLK